MQTTFSSLSSAATSGPAAKYVSAFRALPDGGIQMAETRWPAGEFCYSRRPELTLTRTVQAKKCPNARSEPDMKSFRTGELHLTPAEHSEKRMSDTSGQFISLAIPVDHLEKLGGLACSDFDVLHEGSFRCAHVSVLTDQLWRSLDDDHTPCHLLSEGLYQAIIGQLSVLSAQQSPQTVAKDNLIPPGLMHEIDTRIAEMRPDKLSLQEFANLAAMSIPTFTRKFKVTTGQSVHQYVLEKRLTRAKQMLVMPNLSVAQIAYACGFSSQSHMTSLFRNKLGVTPAAYRESFR
jgi:AraC family transcriptional regulator